MTTSHSFYVYIVECSDGALYTGITNNIFRRLAEHNDGIYPTAFTFKRRPVKLRYCEQFEHVSAAISWEKQLQGWNRKRKEALFSDNWAKIYELQQAS